MTAAMFTLKRCPGCDTSQPFGEFYPDATKKLGIGTYCKACSVLRAAVAYEARKMAAKEIPTVKACGTCNEELAASSFWRAPASRDGLMPECKDCRRERVRAARYGMPIGEFDRMFEQQQGACASCSADDRALVVDHRRSDGLVRGLLCNQCNTAIGLMSDEPERLIAAAAYLLSTTEESA